MDDDALAAGAQPRASVSSSRASTCCRAPGRAGTTSSLPLLYRQPAAGRTRARRAAPLEQVGLGHRLGHKPSELSGGQNQRVAIARALVADPAILLADEPTGNLDSKTSQEIMVLFDELHQQGRTLILVTHEEEIAAHARRRIRLSDGKIVDDTRLEMDDK